MDGNHRQPARRHQTRRSFIKSVAASAGTNILASPVGVWSASPTVAILLDATDPLRQDPAVGWAIEQLRAALQSRGVPSQVVEEASRRRSGQRIVVAGAAVPVARSILAASNIAAPRTPESLAIVRSKSDRHELLVSGSDARGLVYGLLEVADAITHASSPFGALESLNSVAQRPANPIRSITRLFTSEPEDKPWFYDKSFWQAYLTMLARERFNRFSLALGLGYNSPRNVPDSYFYFPYPFLMSVPGYQVSARGLSDQERDRNLEMLRWIGQQTAARGLHFQLALWTHAYQFVDSPSVNYTIVGLTPQNHAAYCRDALKGLLQTCPAVSGVTFRAHSESGIPEQSYEFWKQIFDGVARCGRRVEIDIHSKGIEHQLIDTALATGMPVNISAKYWAEHMGLPYHQAAIRELERARPAAGRVATVEQQRRFTRYGYADYLREDRRYGVYYRMWPGTQRVLLWGDPVMASAYSRHAGFCGSLGLELCEPLSFKGRMGSGSPAGRSPYADASLRPAGGDWEKYLYGYRVWGRLLYDPDSAPETWGRLLRTQVGAAAAECEKALAQASRILPLVTTAHDPSASNNRYWPEMYTDIPIVDSNRPHPYGDTPNPKRFGTVSPLDPALFSSVEEFAAELIQSRRAGKHSPLDVARWLEEFAKSADRHLEQAQREISKLDDPAFRRLRIDVKAQAALGRFFAEKFRAAVGYALYQQSGDPAALGEALKHYRAARDAWLELARETGGAYAADLTFGREPYLRGHWRDRLAAIEADLADMEKGVQPRPVAAAAENGGKSSDAATAAFLAELSAARPSRPRCQHVPAASFRPGEPLGVELVVERDTKPSSVRLHYRHVNQAEEYQTAELPPASNRYRFKIPGDYTRSPYPLMYYFELRDGKGQAWLYPGLDANLSNQPYFVVRQEKAQRSVPRPSGSGPRAVGRRGRRERRDGSELN